MEKYQEYLICLILSIPFLPAALLLNRLELLAVPTGSLIVCFALSILYTFQSETDRFTLLYMVSTFALATIFFTLHYLKDIWIQTLLIAMIVVGSVGLWLVLNKLFYPNYPGSLKMG